MKQLSGSDSLFLSFEDGTQMSHVAGLMIYDQSSAPNGRVRFKEILAFLEERITEIPPLRRKLVRTPLGLDRPYWVDDEALDIEFHVRHLALPEPGDWRQLCIQIARLHSRPVDLTRPPWEIYVIEGLNKIPDLPNGSFAVYIKMHHAAVDGEAAAEVIHALHSLVREAQPARERNDNRPGRAPSNIEMMARTIGNQYARAFSAVGLSTEIGRKVLSQGTKQVVDTISGEDAGDADIAGAKNAPMTRFNTKVTPHRVIDAFPLPLEEIMGVRAAFKPATVNDVFMTMCAGGVRRYLEAKNELPRDTMNALVPMSTRGKEKTADSGNQVGMSVMQLGTDIADDVERLLHISKVTKAEKASVEAIGKDLPAKIFNITPTFVAKEAMQRLILPKINMTVSNVRGPDQALFLAGAELVACMPINVLMHGLGLAVTGFSFKGKLWVCFVADREAVPDPAFLAKCLLETFDNLRTAAQAPAGAKKAKKKKRKTTKTN